MYVRLNGICDACASAVQALGLTISLWDCEEPTCRQFACAELLVQGDDNKRRCARCDAKRRAQ